MVITLKLNFLLAKKTPNVKWNKIIYDDIAPATPKPWEPYANKHMGKPIFPVLGSINGGNSIIGSFFMKKRKIIPTIAKPIIANK